MRYEQGDAATLTTTIMVAGVPTNATVTITVTKPDGNTSTPSVTSVGTGQYRASVLLDQEGTWRYRWVATGAATASESGSFEVRPAPTMLCQVEDVEAVTGQTFATLAERERVKAEIVGVSMAIVGWTGQSFLRRQRTVEIWAGEDDEIELPARPVVSVESVNVDGVILTPTLHYRLEGSSLRRLGGWPWGRDYHWSQVMITYTAGYAVVPDDIVNLCARRVGTRLQTPAGVRQYSIGSFSATISNETLQGGWSAEELDVLKRYGRKQRAGWLRVR